MSYSLNKGYIDEFTLLLIVIENKLAISPPPLQITVQLSAYTALGQFFLHQIAVLSQGVEFSALKLMQL